MTECVQRLSELVDRKQQKLKERRNQENSDGCDQKPPQHPVYAVAGDGLHGIQIPRYTKYETDGNLSSNEAKGYFEMVPDLAHHRVPHLSGDQRDTLLTNWVVKCKERVRGVVVKFQIDHYRAPRQLI